MAYTPVPANAGGGGGGGGATDHGALTGLGDNDHPQYNLAADTLLTHGATSGTKRRLVAGTNVTFDDTAANVRTVNATGGGVTDHGALTGLADNDHTQYALVTDVDAVTMLTHGATTGNRRRLVAGTNVTFDDTAANVRTVNVAAGGSPKDLSAYWLDAAATKLGVSGATLLYTFHDFTTRGVNGLTLTNTGTGAGASYVDGAVQLSKGSTAGGNSYAQPAMTLTTVAKIIPVGASDKWWAACYFRNDTAAAGGGIAAMGGYGPSVPEWWLGYHATYSATNWIFWGRTGGAIDSGVAVDTGVFHEFQGWRDGTTGNLQIDGGSVVQGNVLPTTTAAWHMMIYDSAAAVRTLTVVAMAIARVRP